MYSSLHSGLFEGYDMVLYEPVVQVKDFRYKSLVLIGEWDQRSRGIQCPPKVKGKDVLGGWSFGRSLLPHYGFCPCPISTSKKNQY